jgi:hypothetical protein
VADAADAFQTDTSETDPPAGGTSQTGRSKIGTSQTGRPETGTFQTGAPVARDTRLPGGSRYRGLIPVACLPVGPSATVKETF